MDDAVPRMLVVIDECLPARSFRQIFEQRGHEVRSVGDGFPSGSPDPAILAAADALGAIVVSTDTDWGTLIRGVQTTEERGRFRRASRVLFNCPHNVAIRRLEELIEDIEREHLIAHRQGRQLMMRITGGNFRVDR